MFHPGWSEGAGLEGVFSLLVAEVKVAGSIVIAGGAPAAGEESTGGRGAAAESRDGGPVWSDPVAAKKEQDTRHAARLTMRGPLDETHVPHPGPSSALRHPPRAAAP
ncbi:hypothetical protein GCM10022247_13890 [Allokutzneria multivorans]|uniref:Uncharacterized protein n=1 Tax=Allokutzneria multivorans TaxID=1142134 RepID=A0ABP7RCM4_9PSEU